MPLRIVSFRLERGVGTPPPTETMDCPAKEMIRRIAAADQNQILQDHFLKRSLKKAKIAWNRAISLPQRVFGWVWPQ